MLDPTARPSVSRQTIMLGISRGSVYYKPRPVSDIDLKLMHRIDRLHTPRVSNLLCIGEVVQVSREEQGR